MTWATKLHRLSKDFAIEAERASRDGAEKESKDFFGKAAELETQALISLPATKPRTRGVIAVHAVWLWTRAGEYCVAIQLIDEYILDATISKVAKDKLERWKNVL